MFLPLPTDAVTLTHATPAPAPADDAARASAVPPGLAALADELVESVPVRLTTTSDVAGAPADPRARRPVLVARPRTAHEVAQVVRAARAHGVPVAVPSDERGAATRDAASPRGVVPRADAHPGAHAVDGVTPHVHALDGAVLVSTQGLTGVTVLPVLARAHVGAGVRWRDLLAAAAHYGLVPVAALVEAPDAEHVAVASGTPGPGARALDVPAPDVGAPAARGPDARAGDDRGHVVRVPDDARVTDALTVRGVRAVSVVTGTGALRRVVPADLAGSSGGATARGARGVVVAVELDLVERPAP